MITSLLAVLATTVIRVHYPVAGHELTLRGGAPLGWDQPQALTPVGDDTYEWRTDGIPPAEIKPLLDGAWSAGANYRIRAGAVNDLSPHFRAHAGRVFTLDASFHSAILANDRAVRIYLPPSYDENTAARYPVLYMQDGQNVFGGGWMVDHALDALYEGNDPPREAIVVATANIGATRFAEYTPTPGGMGGGRADEYLRMLKEEMKPRVDRTLRTLPAARDTGIAGSSLGGLQAVFAAQSTPGDYGFVGAFSPSTWWDGAWIVPKVASLKSANPRPQRIYVDWGGAGDGGTDTTKLIPALQAAGYDSPANFKFVVEDGAPHNESSWARRFPAAARFLLGPR